MNRKELFKLIQKKRSFLCIGLDSDITKIPKYLMAYDDPVFEFNKQVIDHTHEYTIAYKPNLAFYESRGYEGWKSLEKTIHYLKKFDVFTIADAKRVHLEFLWDRGTGLLSASVFPLCHSP